MFEIGGSGTGVVQGDVGDETDMEQQVNTKTDGSEDVLALRDVTHADLPLFFAYQQDAEANYMAAFTARDPADWNAFLAHWTRVLDDDTATNQTILYNGKVIGHVASFEQMGQREVTYWLDRAYWGQGLATRALAELLRHCPVRPLYARAVKDNVASLRVLAKCGFVIVGEDRDFANARGQEVEEFVLELRADAAGAGNERTDAVKGVSL
jgi:RimJ/RimL family protein N-acetyltransferase